MMSDEQGLMKLKEKARRAQARSQYRVSVHPGDILRLLRDYEALQQEHARCIKPPPPTAKDRRPRVEI
jgi:hypothetical protein